MIAKEMFEELGYIQKIYDNNEISSYNGIQYTKRDKDSEMQRIGMVTTKTIEFYPSGKDILIYSTTEFKKGNITKSDSEHMTHEEFLAMKQQITELGW